MPSEQILQFFEFRHLPEKLQAISEPFFTMALNLMENIPQNNERAMALRKLLEAKDCAVRAYLFNAEI